jgi:hypothetical protein
MIQLVAYFVASKMLVEAAPSPEGIYWRNVGLPGKAIKTGTMLSLAATMTLCFFWTIPMSFLSSLTEINSIKESLPRLADFLEDYPSLESALALLAPLFLILLNEALLPVFLNWFSSWEGHVGAPTLEAAVFVKLSAFQVRLL